VARYTGPRSRLCRLGVNIFGAPRARRKCPRARPYPPGEHGRTRRRGQPSEYLLQLQEKQKARFIYGLLRAQFRNLYEEANRRKGVTGENLLRCSSCASTTSSTAPAGRHPPQARQFVNHGHVDVNGKRVDIPSYRSARATSSRCATRPAR
jgi:small subunit ribosomal protein S4